MSPSHEKLVHILTQLLDKNSEVGMAGENLVRGLVGRQGEEVAQQMAERYECSRSGSWSSSLRWVRRVIIALVVFTFCFCGYHILNIALEDNLYEESSLQGEIYKKRSTPEVLNLIGKGDTELEEWISELRVLSRNSPNDPVWLAATVSIETLMTGEFPEELNRDIDQLDSDNQLYPLLRVLSEFYQQRWIKSGLTPPESMDWTELNRLLGEVDWEGDFRTYNLKFLRRVQKRMPEVRSINEQQAQSGLLRSTTMDSADFLTSVHQVLAYQVKYGDEPQILEDYGIKTKRLVHWILHDERAYSMGMHSIWSCLSSIENAESRILEKDKTESIGKLRKNLEAVKGYTSNANYQVTESLRLPELQKDYDLMKIDVSDEELQVISRTERAWAWKYIFAAAALILGLFFVVTWIYTAIVGKFYRPIVQQILRCLSVKNWLIVFGISIGGAVLISWLQIEIWGSPVDRFEHGETAITYQVIFGGSLSLLVMAPIFLARRMLRKKLLLLTYRTYLIEVLCLVIVIALPFTFLGYGRDLTVTGAIICFTLTMLPALWLVLIMIRVVFSVRPDRKMEKLILAHGYSQYCGLLFFAAGLGCLFFTVIEMVSVQSDRLYDFSSDGILQRSCESYQKALIDKFDEWAAGVTETGHTTE